ncbi:MAG: DUF3826 domain-containing protein [Verrucomicrobiae bacterium]|nr:DUF3826 domain-containing protein [Verrucomicrobiae bacterium]
MTSYQPFRACFLGALALAGASLLSNAAAQEAKSQASTPGQVPPLPPVLLEMIPAFPGAWGGGMFTTGGRGGRVIAVTNLNDSGEGSFRAAIEAEGPRIVVFRVAGIIYLDSAIDIDNPDITIAGQSAPGDGVCLAHDSVNINTNNVIMRHLRVRRGRPEGGQGSDNIGGNPESQIIVDHCSASWGMDENLSLYRHMKYREGKTDLKFPVKNLTVQYCISSEALNAKNHAFGGTWGGLDATFHHNLLACNTGRNPSIGMGGEFDYRNNVVFNWRHRTMDGGDETSMINVINNYYKPGPATNANMRNVMVRIEQRDQYSPGRLFEAGNWYPLGIKRPGKWYVAGNVFEEYPEITTENWKGMQGPEELARVNTAFEGWPVNQQSAEDAYEAVLASAGATLPRRDAVDARVIEAVRTGKVHNEDGIVRDPKEVGGYPDYTFDATAVPVDGDGDGMPDKWEMANGLKFDDPSDGSTDSDADGYTNVEEFLNGTDPQEAIDYRNLGNNVDSNSGGKITVQTSSLNMDPAYTKVLIARAEKIIDGMEVEDSARRLNVRDLIVAQYRTLSSIHDQRNADLASAETANIKEEIRSEAKGKVDLLHASYIAALGKELRTEQVKQVKDGMTYGVVDLTYAVYLKMLPELTDEQKATIMKNLVEARELAMDGGSAKEKHEIFGKYKGRINNYLSREGYDLRTASKAMEAKSSKVGSFHSF